MATKEIEHNLPQGLFTLTSNFEPQKIKNQKKNYEKDIIATF